MTPLGGLLIHAQVFLDHSGRDANARARHVASVARAGGPFGSDPIRNPGQRDHDESEDARDPYDGLADVASAVNLSSHVFFSLLFFCVAMMLAASYLA